MGVEEVRGPRARRPVHVALEPADLDPIVTAARMTHGLGDRPPGIERQIERRPQREVARPLEAAVAGEIGPRRRYVRGRRDAQGSGIEKRAGEGRVALGQGRLGDRAADEIERPVLEDAGRLTRPRVPENLAPGWGGGVLRDGGGSHGRRVRKRLMAVYATHEYRIARCHRIDPLVTG